MVNLELVLTHRPMTDSTYAFVVLIEGEAIHGARTLPNSSGSLNPSTNLFTRFCLSVSFSCLVPI